MDKHPVPTKKSPVKSKGKKPPAKKVTNASSVPKSKEINESKEINKSAAKKTVARPKSEKSDATKTKFDDSGQGVQPSQLDASVVDENEYCFQEAVRRAKIKATETIAYQLTMATCGGRYYAFVMIDLDNCDEEVYVLRIFNAESAEIVYHYLAKNWDEDENKRAAEMLNLTAQEVVGLTGNQLDHIISHWNSPTTAFHVVEIEIPTIVDLSEGSESENSIYE